MSMYDNLPDPDGMVPGPSSELDPGAKPFRPTPQPNKSTKNKPMRSAAQSAQLKITSLFPKSGRHKDKSKAVLVEDIGPDDNAPQPTEPAQEPTLPAAPMPLNPKDFKHDQITNVLLH